METPTTKHLTDSDFENVYKPAEDSFLLLDALEDDLDFLQKIKPIVVLEIGSGSGVIVTALSKNLRNCLCLSTDINIYACKATRNTAKCNRTFVDTICTNLHDNVRNRVVDLLVFNPPYVVTTDEELLEPSNSKLEFSEKTREKLIYSWAGGLNGRRVIDELINRLDGVLSSNGVLYLLLLKENKPDEVIEKINSMKFKATKFKERRIPSEFLYIIKVVR